MYAAEGQCFVVASTAIISPELRDMLCEGDESREKLIKVGGGYARIFGPDGAPHGEPLAPEEDGLLIADINLGQIPYAKAAADPVGHYARPDVVKLLFNNKPSRAVVLMEGDDIVPVSGTGTSDDSAQDDV